MATNECQKIVSQLETPTHQGIKATIDVNKCNSPLKQALVGLLNIKALKSVSSGNS